MNLPVDDIFPQLLLNIQQHKRVILQAPPGAGKSTRLPLLLLQAPLDSNFHPNNQIIILEPRRVAARQIASYLAAQLGEKVGQTIGLQMRGESKVSPNTVIKVVTDGVMVRQLQSDPELNQIGLIIFDEFHERALQTDLALALTLDAQELNDDLQVLIMSATLDLAKLSEQLEAPIVASQGRQYPVDIEYVPASLIPTVNEICAVIKSALTRHDSSILVFLSGVAEIKQVQQRLVEDLPDEIQILPLYGGLTIAEQSQAITPCQQGRKVVLATNIAQTSLTIDGVDVVVDAGTEKVLTLQPKLNVEQLITQPISLAAATQRAGRAGRLRPGFCYRLGSAEQYERRRQYDVAEIERVDLSSLLLEVLIWGVDFDELFWLSKPAPSLLQAAKSKLVELGYCRFDDSKQKLHPTSLASDFQKIGANLRTAKMLLKATELEQDSVVTGLVQTACLLATYLDNYRGSQQADLASILEHLPAWQWQQFKSQTNRYLTNLGRPQTSQLNLNLQNIGLLLAFAFPDHIAKKQGKRWKMSNGSGVAFHLNQVEANCEYIVVAEFTSSQYGQYIQLYAELDLQQLQSLWPELIIEKQVSGWSEQQQAPYMAKQTQIGQLILASEPLPLVLSEAEWQQVWLDYIEKKGANALAWQADGVTTLLAKWHLVKQHLPEYDWPNWDLAWLQSQPNIWLTGYLGDIRSATQLKQLNLADILFNSLDWSLQKILQQACPEYYLTPAGNQRKIYYCLPQPKLSVKLQEMFGEPVTPTVCMGRQGILVELLSPAQRPLQVTQDLANFWNNAYQEVKKEMKGRYPKHPWPDDPVNFVATHKTKAQLARQKNK